MDTVASLPQSTFTNEVSEEHDEWIGHSTTCLNGVNKCGASASIEVRIRRLMALMICAARLFLQRDKNRARHVATRWFRTSQIIAVAVHCSCGTEAREHAN